MNESFPLLSVCLAWPVLAAALLGMASARQAQWLALAAMLIELILTLSVVAGFDAGNAEFQFVEDLNWIPNLNIHYQLGVDGLSLLFLPATALVSLMALLASWNSVQTLKRFHLALLLLLESITLGVFTALDLALFFLFWELTLPPIFFLIGLWGIGPQRRLAAMKYTLFMLFGGVPLLFAIIFAAQQATVAGLNFSLPLLLQALPDMATQRWLFWLFLLGFAVKAPLAPLHPWLSTTALEAPTHVTALLVGLKLGVYGMLRFALPLAPAAALEHQWLLAILGAVSLIYGALLALRQTNLRGVLACSSFSHVGLVVIGIASFNLTGLQGAVLQLLNFSVVASALMLISGMLQRRLGSTESVHLGGLAKPLPKMTVLFFVFALASIGLPMTNGFPAELMMLIGALQAFPVLAAVALFAAVLGAAYLLGFARRLFFGPIKQAAFAQTEDLRALELTVLTVPAALVLLIGLFPHSVLNIQRSSLESWLNQLHKPAVIQAHQSKTTLDNGSVTAL